MYQQNNNWPQQDNQFQGYSQPYPSYNQNQPGVQVDIQLTNNQNFYPPPQNNMYPPAYQPLPQQNFAYNQTIDPNSLSLGIQQQNNNQEMENDIPASQGDYDKHQKYNQPPQDQKSSNKPTQKLSLRRSISQWGSADSQGTAMICISYLGTIVILAIMISLMIFHFGSKDLRLSSSSGGLEYMVQNLNSDPILKITSANSIQACPLGTTAIHFGRWPGTNLGCKCPISGLKQGACSSKNDLFCSSIDPIDFIDMFKWKGLVMCATRAQLNKDYIKAAACPAEYSKECSSGLCFKQSVDCPITSLDIIGAGDPSQSLSMSTKNNIGESPLIDLDISLNDIPCFSTTEIPKGKGDYMLLSQRPAGCLTYGEDTLFSNKVDWMSEDKVMKSNEFPKEVYDLPDYQAVIEAASSVLSTRERIAVANNDKCLSVDTTVLNNAGTAASNMNKYMNYTAVTAMIIHGILALLLIINFIVFRKANVSWKGLFMGEKSGSWIALYGFFGASDIIVFIVMTALMNSSYAHLNSSREYLVDLDESGCFPQGPPKAIIADYDNLTDQVGNKLKSYSAALLGISLITYAATISIFLSKKYRNK